MRKIAILIRKLHKQYKNKSNWEYSLFKGYPKHTYFGFESFEEFKTFTIEKEVARYGKRLRKM